MQVFTHSQAALFVDLMEIARTLDEQIRPDDSLSRQAVGRSLQAADNARSAIFDLINTVASYMRCENAAWAIDENKRRMLSAIDATRIARAAA